MADSPKAKPAGTLSNGISIGLGAAALALGLLMTFFGNAVYAKQTAYLAAKGIQAVYSPGFSDLVYLISTGVLVSILGAYLLAVGCLSNFSKRAHAAFSDNGNWGNRLINGGVLGSSLISAGIVRDLYQSNPPDWYTLATVSLIVVCLILIVTGVQLLIRIPSSQQSPKILTASVTGESLSVNP